MNRSVLTYASVKELSQLMLQTEPHKDLNLSYKCMTKRRLINICNILNIV